MVANTDKQLVSYHNKINPVSTKSEADSATFKTDKGYEVVSKKFKREWGKLPEKI